MKGRFVEEIYIEEETDDAFRSSRMLGSVILLVICFLLVGAATALMLWR